MKILIVFGLLLSLNVMAADTDFRCYSPKSSGEAIEVFFVKGQFSYFPGRMIDVAVKKKSNNGKIQTVSGVAQDIYFAGGGTQNVSVSMNLKTRKGELTIFTKTFYHQREKTHPLICILL